MANMETTLAELALIPGGQLLIDWLRLPKAYTHDFGDDEIVAIILNREGHSQIVLESSLRLNEQWKMARITLFLTDLIDVQINGFAKQNVIDELTISRCPDFEPHPTLVGIGMAMPDHLISIAPLAGPYGTIRATITRVEVLRS